MNHNPATRTTRRDFLKHGALASFLLALPKTGAAATPKSTAATAVFDVIVAGGGPAGVCAAVAAARNGASTLLLERGGLLGGMLTAGHVNPILGMTGPGTMADELIRRLSLNGEITSETTRNGREVYIDVEHAKTALFNFAAETDKLTCWLQSAVVDVSTDASGAIASLLVGTPQGLVNLSAKTFVDATGDGSVAAFAGADYEIGRADGLMQPVTLEFTLSNVDETRAITAYGGSDPVKLPSGQRYSAFCKEANARGELPENVTIVRLHRTARPGERNVNATQSNRVNALVPAEIFSSTRDLRNQIAQTVRFLQRHIPGYENCLLKSSGSVLGVRETRRVTGRYILNDHDVETGSKFPDAVVRDAWFLIDIHNPAGGGQAEKQSKIAKPYDIPLRSLIPLKIPNLLLAGRCISGTHRAHASYRVMAICMATGQAAGTAAALCAKTGAAPGDLPPAQVRAALAAQGVSLA
ncbi:MAG: FAD-dependent oxidoreductase [Opitutaceae bacterium]|jgi:hypothetical protein|nr:FAD-dependent oxidoreductase [Opitutaceae bacterium]